MVPDSSYKFDLFVSHASEDKPRFVDALVTALRDRGLRVWYDSNEIGLGDDFRRKIDDGLSRSRFGVVVLSPNFFRYWPQTELSALFNQEATSDQTRILPIRLDLDRATLTARSPLIGGRADLGWELGPHVIAERILERLRAMPPSTRPSPIYNAPARRARRLFGREVDLECLEQLLVPGRNVRVAATIEGLAGVGKTELALHLVDRLSERARFPGGIFWLDAENPDLTVAWGSTIADALAVGPGTVEERAAAAVRIASVSESVLVVLDNVEKWTRESEPHPLPHGSRVALLATTRHRFLAGPSFEHYALDTLPDEAAREFLNFVAGRELLVDDLLRHLDGHTLAIELAGAYLRELPSVTPARYLARLTEGVPVEEKVQDLVRYESTVNRALDLHSSHLDPAAREALLIAACFAPEDASVALLEACGVDAEVQQPLRRFHLITGNSERWRMHRLVREWARRSASSEDLMQAKRRFVGGCVEFSAQITFDEGFRFYRVDGPHMEEAVCEVEVIPVSDDDRAGALLNGRLAIALYSLGDLRRARTLFERALGSDLKSLGEDHPSVADLRSDLALVLMEQGNLADAKDLLERALESDVKNLGEDHPSVAIKSSNLGLVLQRQGDLPGAHDLLARALELDLKNFGESHQSVAERRSNLAMVLKDLGDLPRAKELLELALPALLNNLDEDQLKVATCRSNLGLVLMAMGDFSTAKDLFERALASTLRTMGADHPTVGKLTANLAVAVGNLGDLARARELHEQALEAALKNFGEEHPSVALQRRNLAFLLLQLRDVANAHALLEQALSTQERFLGADHPSTSHTRVVLALILRSRGHADRARAEAEHALRSVADQPAGSRDRTQVEWIAEHVLGES